MLHAAEDRRRRDGEHRQRTERLDEQERPGRAVDVGAGAQPARRRVGVAAPRLVPSADDRFAAPTPGESTCPPTASASVVTGTVKAVSTNGAVARSSLRAGRGRRVVPVEAEVLEVVVLVLEVAVDVRARPRDRRAPEPRPVRVEDERAEHQHRHERQRRRAAGGARADRPAASRGSGRPERSASARRCASRRARPRTARRPAIPQRGLRSDFQ